MQHDTKPAPRDENWQTTTQLHGVLVRVFGTGVLLIGESGIGKSECALDLISRGHKLVADDVIVVSVDRDQLLGGAPELTSELLEIRGLGVINVREAFGETAVSNMSTLELCVELQKEGDVERVGNVIQVHDIAGRAIPKFVLPVSPGRNLATLVETAVRLHMNHDAGHNAAERLIEEQQALISSGRQV